MLNNSKIDFLKFLAISFFSVAMGYLESAVVIYLRKIYYPAGFSFPLMPMDHDLVMVEFYREIATVIMLLGVAIIAGRNKISRFAWFLYCFSIWDIFYYVFLKIFLGWPTSFLTWDVLFLIPVPWTGPVITPIILALGMAIFGLFLLKVDNTKSNVTSCFTEWILLILGTIVIIVSWCWDYCRQMITNSSFSDVWTLSGNSPLFEDMNGYVPERFNWFLFGIGLIMCGFGMIIYYMKAHKTAKP